MSMFSVGIIILILCGGIIIAFWAVTFYEAKKEGMQVLWFMFLIVIIGGLSVFTQLMFVWKDLFIPQNFQQQLINNEGTILANKELQKQQAGNQEIVENCEREIKRVAMDSKRVLLEILKINNIEKKDNEHYELNWENNKWQLDRKL